MLFLCKLSTYIPSTDWNESVNIGFALVFMPNHQHQSALKIHQVLIAVCSCIALTVEIFWQIQANHICEFQILKKKEEKSKQKKRKYLTVKISTAQFLYFKFKFANLMFFIFDCEPNCGNIWITNHIHMCIVPNLLLNNIDPCSDQRHWHPVKGQPKHGHKLAWKHRKCENISINLHGSYGSINIHATEVFVCCKFEFFVAQSCSDVGSLITKGEQHKKSKRSNDSQSHIHVQNCGKCVSYVP